MFPFYVRFQVKLDQSQAPPSKVLHIRNIPQEAQEADILAMAIPFGKPTNLVRPKNKTQVRRVPRRPSSIKSARHNMTRLGEQARICGRVLGVMT